MPTIVTKAKFAELRGISKARVSQYLKLGLPARPDGTLDYEAACDWLARNVADHRTYQPGRQMMSWTKPRARSKPYGPASGPRPAAATGISYAEARRRSEVAKAQERELRLAAQRRELVPVAEVGDAVCQAFSTVRAHLLALPTRMAPRLVGKTCTNEIFALLTAFMHEALTELSETKVVERGIGEDTLDDDASLDREVSYGEARARHAAVKAELAELELKRRKGELIDRARTVALVFKLAREERDSWEGWPARVAALIANELGTDVHRTHQVLERHVRQHLSTLADVRFDPA